MFRLERGAVLSAVPSGRAMGPTLFLIYVSDLLDTLDSNRKMLHMIQMFTEALKLSKIIILYRMTSASYMLGVALGFRTFIKKHAKLFISARITQNSNNL